MACTILTMYSYIHDYNIHNHSETTVNNMSSVAQSFLSKQSEAYQRHLRAIRTLEKTLHQQQEVKQFQTIPKKHNPIPLETADATLTTKFNQQYKQLFFQHLNEVITSNTVHLQLHKVNLASILAQTERHLSSLNSSHENITQLYQQFLAENSITDHIPIPTLQAILNPTPASNTQRRRRMRKRKRDQQPPATKQTKQDKPNSVTTINTVHNLSSATLTQEELNILDKGLSFAPTPTTPQPEQQLLLLRHYNDFARSLRHVYSNQQYHTASKKPNPPPPTTTSKLHRSMKFIPNTIQRTLTQQYSGIGKLEHYIDLTKNNLNDELPMLTDPQPANLTTAEQKALRKLSKSKHKITVKPADKNLGVVIMDTDDYISQCTATLSDTNTYRNRDNYPTKDIQRKLLETLLKFKGTLQAHSKKLFNYLLPTDKKFQTPKFYGLPKIHKKFTRLPPLRPIVSHSDSILAPTARLLDHTLQPLAQSYPDYLQNSTALSIILEDLHVPDDAILVSIDVTSLYPSIPQTECLDILYNEMYNRRHLLLFNPNLLIQLLHTNVNYNYFEFASLIFQQTKGTAMGAAFSPTIANIFMSVFLRRFLHTQEHRPLLLKRYIDDILLIWDKSTEDLESFLTALNAFHPSLHFTFTHSSKHTNFLDLEIYKGLDFPYTNILDTKTYQKDQNLYQYLHFTSNHSQQVHKAIITGECTRYVRTNTKPENYKAIVSIFIDRLQKRGYPRKFIQKTAYSVKFSNRHKYLQNEKTPRRYIQLPLFKSPPLPQYKALKHNILQHYPKLHLATPRFITLSTPTLRKELIRAVLKPTDEQFLDISYSVQDSTDHATAGRLPQLRSHDTRTKPCRHPRCATCQHLNCSKSFTSTRTGKIFFTRHNFSCTSKNVIYLITCTECKKQYVGQTSQQLNTRINHHRSSIFNKSGTYISNHFNFPDHTIQNLKVQAIDQANTRQELNNLEKFWIQTLDTVQPFGLNVSRGIV